MIFVFFKDLFIYFLERGEGREKEREKHQCVVTTCAPPAGDLAHNPECAPTGNQTSDLLVRRLALNPLNHTSLDFYLFITSLV